ncbi:hypothetical protein [Nocardia aurantia]|uniref:Lipocalin-like domain-containing protein n=1 Tax=Nocardia aurantia TaxID=2585199 RepID=A0A7K0DWG7_9NOCA|nr:hypothetical protein [Nocardia aurantia]MQY30121.1 hypothetical protein [Nocardia aurantia]
MTSQAHPIVGVWEVTAPDAPFPHHVMTFHADGTMAQSNPDLGNRGTSDSGGMGIWRADGGEIAGKFVEYTVDRAEPSIVRRGVVEFRMVVAADEFRGDAAATFARLPDGPVTEPARTSLYGRRLR